MNSNYLERFLSWLTPLKKEPPGLLEAVNSARRDWKQAQHDFNFISDKNMIDCTVHKIKASERQYIALLKAAKQQNITAWQWESPPVTATSGEACHATEQAN
ncbi:DUF2508 family protein [Desulfallas thermosapovorans]|uniref:Uncharacterized protein DUF2508 n=1 Tax=Desulfallas thermosapovorans DSM 6562 TaxID=1121431 RepID=A0A5S4ZPL8_9FIRM|nr:DUF2508 family protein [Desulfallas thermosapovorans]TYO94827.1 uncharacterized protein DUF2508 [Desulfallas thermosapovorans DSM 6562]